MTPPRLPRPPSPFPGVNRHIVPAGTVLHRNHARAFGPAQFNPGQGQSQTTGNGLAAASPNVSGAQFGSIKAANDPRIGQLALKLIF